MTYSKFSVVILTQNFPGILHSGSISKMVELEALTSFPYRNTALALHGLVTFVGNLKTE